MNKNKLKSTVILFLVMSAVGLMMIPSALAHDGRTKVDTRIFFGNAMAPCYDGSGDNCGQYVPVGSIVYDMAKVSSYSSSITPSRTVTFMFYNNLNCRDQSAFKETVPLAASSIASLTKAVSSKNGPLAAGHYSYRAVYNPDGAAVGLGLTRTPGDCEQLAVVNK